MRRSGAVLAIAIIVAASWIVAGPASAKGPVVVEATITGPGIEAPIVLTDPDGPVGLNNTADARRLGLLAEQTGIYDRIFGSEGVTAREPTGELGERFTIIWTLAMPGVEGGAPRVFVSDLYPYADGGPVSFTHAAGFEMAGITAEEGWHHAPPALVENLEAWGLPGRAESAPSNQASDEIAVTPADIPWPWLVPIVLLVAVAATVRLVNRRRRAAY